MRQGLVALDMALDHIDEVDQARILEPPRDLQSLVERDPFIQIVLVDHHAHADDEIGSGGAPDLLQHRHRKAHAVLEAAAVIVVALVGRRRKEGIEQMAVGFNLDPVEPAFATALHAGAIGLDHPLDLEILHHLRKGAMRRFARRRRRNDRQPVFLAPIGAAAEMGDLAHYGAVICVHRIGELSEPGNDCVGAGAQIAEACGESRLTTAEPPIMVMAQPPFAFST